MELNFIETEIFHYLENISYGNGSTFVQVSHLSILIIYIPNNRTYSSLIFWSHSALDHSCMFYGKCKEMQMQIIWDFFICIFYAITITHRHFCLISQFYEPTISSSSNMNFHQFNLFKHLFIDKNVFFFFVTF